jgi:hypothetical protein
VISDQAAAVVAGEEFEGVCLREKAFAHEYLLDQLSENLLGVAD